MTAQTAIERAQELIAGHKAAAAASAESDKFARVMLWVKANPDVMAWIDANAESNSFAMSLATHLDQRGTLTDGQCEAVRKILAPVPAAAIVESAGVGQIESAFDTARDRGVEKPAMRLDTFKFKAAGANSSNPGSIYVTEDGEYLGKITGNAFRRARECSDEQAARIVAAASNPSEAATAYGQRTGCCSICSRKLTAEQSLTNSIGPICAEKYGF